VPGSQYIALSGMRSRLDQLDRVATDIANAGTAGYKSQRSSDAEADRPQFESMLASAIDVTTGSQRLDTRPGTITPTGRDLDFALEGNGFFSVQAPAGVRYTRNGHFGVRADGSLITEDGYPVLGTNGPLKLGPGKVSVDSSGVVRAGEATAGQLAIVSFDDPGAMTREGASLLRADNQAPKPVAQPTVYGGTLEQSNASIVDRIAEMTSVSRSFEALQKAVSLVMNDIDGRAIDTLGRR